MGRTFTLKATNNTRPGTQDPVTKKWKNMSNKDYKEHRAINKEKLGPGWVYCPPPHEAANGLLSADANPSADFRHVLMDQWVQVQYENGWNLVEEWRKEAADFYGPGDKAIEEAEKRNNNNATEESDKEVIYLLRVYMYMMCVHKCSFIYYEP